MDERTELLARMWIVCDPNRDPSNPDEPIDTGGRGTMDGQPRWAWFVPRATASMDYFRKHGWKLVKDNVQS